MVFKSVCDFIEANKDRLVAFACMRTQQEFPKSKYIKACKDDIVSMLDAVILDIYSRSDQYTRLAALNFVASQGNFAFLYNKKYIVSSLEYLKVCTSSLFFDPVIKLEVMSRFNNILDVLRNSTLTDIKRWRMVGSILPSVFLIAVTGFSYFSYDQYLDLTLIAMAAILTISTVIWWSWATFRIGQVVMDMNQSKKHVRELIGEINSVKTGMSSTKGKNYE